MVESDTEGAYLEGDGLASLVRRCRVRRGLAGRAVREEGDEACVLVLHVRTIIMSSRSTEL